MSTGLSQYSPGQPSRIDQNSPIGDGGNTHHITHLVSPGAISIESVSALDEYAANPRFQELNTELRSLLLLEAQSNWHTAEHTPERQSASTDRLHGHGLLSEHLARLRQQIPLTEQIMYLNIWTTECAPWLDMFDQERHFGLQVPILAQTSPAVFYALLALSARQAERNGVTKSTRQHSLGLYSEAISSLSPALHSKQPDVIVTACILCVLEMMSVSPRNWRRHSEGCAALFEAMQVNGFSGGLLQTVFWCYARMDLCAAIIAEGAEGTILPIEKWVLLDTTSTISMSINERQRLINESFLEQGRRIPDMHANYAVYLCARVCNLTARRTQYLELGDENGCQDEAYEEMWRQLWEDLQQWLERRPAEILPVKTIAGSRDTNQFPRIFFAHWAAISSNQLYHTACILMLDMKPMRTTSGGGLASSNASAAAVLSPLWHARRVVGISLANDHRGSLNNAIQPLYVAGKLFTHREEHVVISDLLNHIEASSGWGSRWRIKGLETAWGYRRSVLP